ncbi:MULTISPECIES: DNA cytosine methyltransferase [unclassified Ensifer]|uniref:DNA cytosine methyltransferase n=1 Tax=unclassified Ensifer TaxID=2633371 RepID=UPI0008138559|nr:MULTISPECIES: DNA cytosine methyltransferase [unclassified Ensifer]OCP05013.1 DNA methyltransferase [Ensifer sp. LC14]OCP11828.1 DNA methyltransferase [Ensifer sp. LC13]OCP12384.1 DNA methyltransferase [Ensifer sp. LC11]OCP33648.1 DNA methyltransferase [Ensifer sp. LC499]
MFRAELFAETSMAAMSSGWGDVPLIVDSFAGGGGASTGIEMALGRSPDIAINHSADALALHAANHPDTLHLSENVYKVDPLDHMRGKHIGLAWFSPDCKHFSKAKGGKPVERNIRDLCWIIPGWVERIQNSGGKVDVVIMENVEEFKDYGPLIETGNGLRPDPERKGATYRKWCRTLRGLGAKMESRELRGRDFGAPTIRKRLFIIMRFDGQKIVWPQPTHGDPNDRDVIAGRKLPWPIVADCIDWSIPCPSIFDTADEIWEKHQVRAKRPLAGNSHERIARGLDRFVIRANRPFLVNLTHGGRIESVDEAMRTITAAHRGEKALISPSVQRFNGGAVGCDVRDQLPTITANGYIKRPGGAAPLGLLAPVLTYAQQGGAVRSVAGQAHTITASDKDQNSVMCAFMAQANNDSRRIGGVNPGRSVDEAASTITQSGSHQQVVSAYIARQFGTGACHSVERAAGTITTEGQGKSQLIMPYLQSYYATGEGSRADEAMRTATVKPRHGLVEAVVDVPPFTEAQAYRARQVADFMRAHGLWDDREFVTVEIDGLTFVIVDIGMRMLTPRELYNAQGFPSDYIIDGAWKPPGIGHNGGPVWVPFSKSVQVSCVGNSVCPPVARALVAANCNHLAVQRAAA